MNDTHEPNNDRDVIVRHVTNSDGGGQRWLVSLRDVNRAEMSDAGRALVFARLLADLSQGRVWIHHDGEGCRLVDTTSIRGCSCC